VNVNTEPDRQCRYDEDPAADSSEGADEPGHGACEQDRDVV
jgi:hypothetical protein